jgi:hypothetical protein
MGLTSAARYAKMHATPEIVRVIVPPYVHLEKDPEGHDEDEMRTSDDIPALFVLPSHPQELFSETIRNINRRFDILLTSHQVEKLTQLLAEKLIAPAQHDPSLLDSVKSFSKMESERSQADIQKICSSLGLDPSQLQPGDTFSLDL